MANDNPECARKFAVADKITGLLKIDLTEADVLLVMRPLTQLQPEHNGERIQRWTLIETLARLLPPGSARTWRA